MLHCLPGVRLPSNPGPSLYTCPSLWLSPLGTRATATPIPLCHGKWCARITTTTAPHPSQNRPHYRPASIPEPAPPPGGLERSSSRAPLTQKSQGGVCFLHSWG